MKGISAIIATVLILIIVISLAGLSYVYISGIFGRRKIIDVLDVYKNQVTIKNVGTQKLLLNEIAITIEGKEVQIYADKEEILPGEVAEIKFIPPKFGKINFRIRTPHFASALSTNIEYAYKTRVVVSAYQADYDIKVVSYSDGNKITYPGGSFVLNRGEIGTIPAASITQGSTINGTGAFSLGTTSGEGDEMVPLKFAGKEFVYDAGRGTQRLYFCSPFFNAVVDIYDNAKNKVTTLNIAKNQCASFTYDFPNDWYKVVSNVPILGQADNNGIDSYVTYPASKDLWGISSSHRYSIGCGEDGTELKIYYSNGESFTYTCNFGGEFTFDRPGSQGCCEAVHIISNKPVGAIQWADCDGVEATSFLPEKELSDVYFLPQDAQYVSIAVTQPNTLCKLFDPNGNLIDQAISGNLPRPFPNHIFFGSTSSGAHILAGSSIICNSTFYAYYERASDDETNMFGLKIESPI